MRRDLEWGLAMKRIFVLMALLAACLVPTQVLWASMAPDSSGVYGVKGIGDADPPVTKTVEVGPEGLVIDNEQLLVQGDSVIEAADGAAFAVRESVLMREPAPSAPQGNSLSSDKSSGAATGVIAPGDSADSGAAVLLEGRSNGSMVATSVLAHEAPAMDLLPGEAPLEGAGLSGAVLLGADFISYDDIAVKTGANRVLRAYGSRFAGEDAGLSIESGAEVTIAPAAQGFDDQAILPVATSDERERFYGSNGGSLIEGASNAVIVLGTPWDPPSEEGAEPAIPKAQIALRGTTLRTDASLANATSTASAASSATQDPILAYTKGTGLVLRSGDVRATISDCTVTLDQSGTGYALQTIPSLARVAEDRPFAAEVNFADMTLAGGVIHEDYDTSLDLRFDDVRFTGWIDYFDRGSWLSTANARGFSDRVVDANDYGVAGMWLTLENGSVWTVTRTSYLTALEVSYDSTIEGTVYLDGAEVDTSWGTYIWGDIVVEPWGDGASGQQAEQGTSTEGTNTEAAGTEEHVHNWTRVGGGPADCTHDGAYTYHCFDCGADRSDPIPALGHDWVYQVTYYPTCDTDGYAEYQCSRCWEVRHDPMPATGHDYQPTMVIPPTCDYQGYTEYECTVCGHMMGADYVPSLGHDFQLVYVEPVTCTSDGWSVYECQRCGMTYNDDVVAALGHSWYLAVPTPGAESLTHTWYCYRCSATYDEYHSYSDPCEACGYSGPKG